MVTVFLQHKRRKRGPLRRGVPGKKEKNLDFLKPKIKILLIAIPCAFEFFGQDIGQVSRLRLGKFTFIAKKLSHFQNFDRFT